MVVGGRGEVIVGRWWWVMGFRSEGEFVEGLGVGCEWNILLEVHSCWLQVSFETALNTGLVVLAPELLTESRS